MFPHTEEVIKSLEADPVAVTPAAVKLLRQYQELTATMEHAVEQFREQANGIEAERLAIRTEREELQARAEAAENKAKNMEDHPDVKAARLKKAKETRDALQRQIAELEKV